MCMDLFFILSRPEFSNAADSNMILSLIIHLASCYAQLSDPYDGDGKF